MFKNKFKTYTIYIRNFENIEKYYKKINFYSNNKIETLKEIVHNSGRISYSHGETKDKIVRLLNKHNLTSSRLAKMLDRKRCTINHFLYVLEKENKVEKVRKMGKHIVWGIKK